MATSNIFHRVKIDNEEAAEAGSDTALLSNITGFTTFKYGDDLIRFAAPYSLIRYVKIKKWDDGYIVVDADYSTLGITEEYIDLREVLYDLYIDADRFLHPIRRVEIDDHEHEGNSR